MDRENLKPIDVPIARECFGCSETNPIGLKLQFFLDSDTQKIYSFFKPTDKHVSWGNITHGGISATILDEMSGWIVILKRKLMCVTYSIETKYFHPLLVGKEYVVTGGITRENSKYACVSATISDSDNKVYVSSTAKLFPMSHSKTKELKIMNDEELDCFIRFLDGFNC